MESYGSWAWAAGIALLVSDIVLPVPSTVVMSALGWMYGWWIGGLICARARCCLASSRMRRAAGWGVERRCILPEKMVCDAARRSLRSAAAGWWPCHAGCRCCRRRWPASRAFRACGGGVFASAGLRLAAHGVCVRGHRPSRSKRTGLGHRAERTSCLCCSGWAAARCFEALTHLLQTGRLGGGACVLLHLTA
jgi:hypothetical protein